MSDRQGWCHEKFAPVREAFDRNFAAGQEVGASVPIRFGMGYGLSIEVMPMGPKPHIASWGGSTVVVDQDARRRSMAASTQPSSSSGGLG